MRFPSPIILTSILLSSSTVHTAKPLPRETRSDRFDLLQISHGSKSAISASKWLDSPVSLVNDKLLRIQAAATLLPPAFRKNKLIKVIDKIMTVHGDKPLDDDLLSSYKQDFAERKDLRTKLWRVYMATALRNAHHRQCEEMYPAANEREVFHEDPCDFELFGLLEYVLDKNRERNWDNHQSTAPRALLSDVFHEPFSEREYSRKNRGPKLLPVTMACVVGAGMDQLNPNSSKHELTATIKGRWNVQWEACELDYYGYGNLAGWCFTTERFQQILEMIRAQRKAAHIVNEASIHTFWASFRNGDIEKEKTMEFLCIVHGQSPGEYIH